MRGGGGGAPSALSMPYLTASQRRGRHYPAGLCRARRGVLTGAGGSAASEAGLRAANLCITCESRRVGLTTAEDYPPRGVDLRSGTNNGSNPPQHPSSIPPNV